MKISNRMKRAVIRALGNLKPDVHYTAGDVTYWAGKHSDAANRFLKSKQTSRILCVLMNEGMVTMHPRGSIDDEGKRTTQRTFTVVE